MALQNREAIQDGTKFPETNTSVITYHICNHRSGMRIRPKCPSEADLAACRNRSSCQLCWRRPRDSSSCVSTALEIDQGQILNGSVALDWSNDTIGRRSGIRVLVWFVSLKTRSMTYCLEHWSQSATYFV
jgi:hypothetical protein